MSTKRVIFWTREEVGRVAKNDERETDLAKALQHGAAFHGDAVKIKLAPGAYDPVVEDCDLICMCGVKSRYWFRAYEAAGIPWLYADKGYIRERAPEKWLSYWRISVNSHHPIAFLEKARMTENRAKAMGFSFDPWRKDRGDHVIVDGGSEKNFKFNGIVPEDATIADVDAHCADLVAQIKRLTDRPVIYRPKPSSRGRHGIEGTEFAYKTRIGVEAKDVKYDLERAHVVVSYSSAIGYEAHRIGVPSIVLGGGPARPISSTSIREIENPRLASDAERRQWLNNLAWCQFKMHEFSDGTAWQIVREMLDCSTVVTSFSREGWEAYAHDFVKTFRQFWPPSVRLICYWEGDCPEDVGEGWNLEALDPCRSFLDRHRENLIVQGRSQCAASPWGPKARADGYSFRHDAYKFARKVFAIAHASRHVELGKLFWIDADVVTFANFPGWVLHELLPDDACLAYLHRDEYPSELGFVGYNLDHVETHAFIMAYESTYAADLFVAHRYWDDCSIFDDLVTNLGPPCARIANSSRAQPFDNSILSQWFYHFKGKRKNHIKEITKKRKKEEKPE